MPAASIPLCIHAAAAVRTRASATPWRREMTKAGGKRAIGIAGAARSQLLQARAGSISDRR